MEDVLSRDAHKLAEKVQREDPPIIHIPADAIDLILNVFINPNYDLTDERAFEAFQEWFFAATSMGTEVWIIAITLTISAIGIIAIDPFAIASARKRLKEHSRA